MSDKPVFPKQEAPFCVQVELTLGCNLNCSFCGIGGIGFGNQKKGLKVMTTAVAEEAAHRLQAIGWNSRIEFARRGEPTLNPHMHEIIAIFREYLPESSNDDD